MVLVFRARALILVVWALMLGTMFSSSVFAFCTCHNSHNKNRHELITKKLRHNREVIKNTLILNCEK